MTLHTSLKSGKTEARSSLKSAKTWAIPDIDEDDVLRLPREHQGWCRAHNRSDYSWEAAAAAEMQAAQMRAAVEVEAERLELLERARMEAQLLERERLEAARREAARLERERLEEAARRGAARREAEYFKAKKQADLAAQRRREQLMQQQAAEAAIPYHNAIHVTAILVCRQCRHRRHCEQLSRGAVRVRVRADTNGRDSWSQA